MARKKNLIVRVATKGRSWSIEIGGQDAGLRAAVGAAIRNAALEQGAVLLNGTDPFGGLPAPRGRKAKGKAGKPTDGAAVVQGGEKQTGL